MYKPDLKTHLLTPVYKLNYTYHSLLHNHFSKWSLVGEYADFWFVRAVLSFRRSKHGNFLPVENISIESGVHALAWSTGTEAATSPHHHIEDAARYKVWVLVAH